MNFPGRTYSLSIPLAAQHRRSLYGHDGLWHDREAFLSKLKQRASKKLDDFKIGKKLPMYEKRTGAQLFDQYEDVWKRSFPGFGSKWVDDQLEYVDLH